MSSRNSGKGRTSALLLGVAMGGGLMALLDPARGAARRSYVRDKMVRGLHLAERAVLKQIKELRNEVQCSIAEQRARLLEGRVSDSRLLQRVRAQVGHVVRNFGALEISVRDGHVTIWGPVLLGEREKIEQRLRETRGVNSFDVSVTEHDDLRKVTGRRGIDEVGPVQAEAVQEEAG